jgi:hypothetical protein
VPSCVNPRPPAQAVSKQLAEAAAQAQTTTPSAERLALEKAMPPRIITMKNEDFAAFREVLEDYKFRNLLAVADSKLTSKEDILRYLAQ